MKRATAALTLAAAAWPLASTAPGEMVVRDVYLMGTRARLATSAPDRADGLATLDRALRVLEATEAELSTWRPDSVISRLNHQPLRSPFTLPGGLCDTFTAILRWHAATAGAFDPAIGRLMDAWGIHSGGHVPSHSVLQTARDESGLNRFHFDERRCEVTRLQPASLDTGGFGKGDALDRVARALGPAIWMIDLGGQVAVHGAPSPEKTWQVAIAHPLERDRAWLQVSLTEGSIATSGGSERDVAVNGRRVGHILDPRSGEPAAFEGSVSVWHPSALAADILSTALYVMGPDEGLAFSERLGIAACYLVPRRDGTVRVLTTPRFRELLS